MSNSYVGYDQKARVIGKIYVGVNDKAKLVRKVYVGVNNKAKRAKYPLLVPIPTIESDTLYYQGREQSITIQNVAQGKVEVLGTTKATNVGSYSVTFRIRPPYLWSNGTDDDIIVPWTINRAQSINVVIDFPYNTQTNNTYNGSYLVYYPGNPNPFVMHADRVSIPESNPGTVVSSTGNTFVVSTYGVSGPSIVDVDFNESVNYPATHAYKLFQIGEEDDGGGEIIVES